MQVKLYVPQRLAFKPNHYRETPQTLASKICILQNTNPVVKAGD